MLHNSDISMPKSNIFIYLSINHELLDIVSYERAIINNPQNKHYDLGTLHQRPIGELVGKCHPLGSFEQVLIFI